MSLGAISADATDNNCGPEEASSGYSGRKNVQGNHTSVEVTEAGNEIYRYCAESGGSVEYVDVDPALSVEITHTSGNKLHHYSYEYRPVPTPDEVDEGEEAEEGEEGDEVDEGDEGEEAEEVDEVDEGDEVDTYLIPPLVWERTPTPTPPAPVAPPAKISVTG